MLTGYIGSIAVAGSAVKFLRDNLGLIKHSYEIGDLAAQVKSKSESRIMTKALLTPAADTGGVIFVTAFSGLFAPYWIDDARGTICNNSLSPLPLNHG